MRTLLVTSTKVYNINQDSKRVKVFSLFNKKAMVKREIPVELITAISVSTESSEFLLHVPSQYDYRFSSPNFRSQIIETVMMAHFNKTKSTAMRVFFHEDVNLTDYVTTEKMAK
jgi:serum/glucocorticoid-regulated kinase 2